MGGVLNDFRSLPYGHLDASERSSEKVSASMHR
jgi:hypothetical protein